MRRDDRGISLIEVIIAIAILVICALPLFRSMVLSARMNADSRILLSATNAAEKIMENLKADGMEEFIRENQGSTEIQEVEYLDESNKGAGYRFVYPEYQMDQQEFRVQVEVRPYQNEESGATDYNTEEVANLYRMNRTTDAIYTENSGIVEEDFLKAVARGEYSSEQREEVLGNLEVHYDYQIISDQDVQRVEQNIIYLYDGKELGEHKTLIYDSSQTEGTLYNLYLFFQPELKNRITIENLQDYPLEVYLVKQGDERMDLSVELEGTALMQNLGTEKDPDFTKGIRLKTNFDDTLDNIAYSYTQKNVKTDLTGAELKKYFDYKMLDDKKLTYRLYDVTVQVLKDKEEITTLTGTVTR